MKKKVKIFIHSFLFFTFILLSSCAKNWSYKGKTAPNYWGDIKKDEYKFCKIGYNQSPINIEFKSQNKHSKAISNFVTTSSSFITTLNGVHNDLKECNGCRPKDGIKKLEDAVKKEKDKMTRKKDGVKKEDLPYNKFKDSDLKFSYSNLGVTKQFNSNFFIFIFDRKDFFTLNKKSYYLQSLQFHHPSEHQINGEEYSLEMQIFHKSDSEQIAALSILIKVGEENSEFNKLIDLLKNPKQEDVWSEFNVGKVIDEKSRLFFYDGSLTTPPCNEGVKWFIMEKQIEMSKEQMIEIIKLGLRGKSNQRPLHDFHPELY